jgi:integrase
MSLTKLPSGRWRAQVCDPASGQNVSVSRLLGGKGTRAFVERYGARQIDLIDDAIVADWLAGGRRNGTIPALRAMFNDAASAKGGRLVRRNPFARLGISRGPGRRYEQPPSEDEVWKIIRCAHQLASPSFAAWLQVAAFTGLRPGELDALRHVNVISIAHVSGLWSSSARRRTRSRRQRTGRRVRRR